MVRKNLSDIHWTRIESWVNARCTRLAMVARMASMFWVELKVTSSNKIKVKPLSKSVAF